MRIGLKARLLIILLLATGIPLTMGLYSAHFFGHRYLLSSKGTLFNLMAERISDALERVIDNEINSITDWVVLSELSSVLEAYLADNQALLAEQYQRKEELDQVWPTLPDSDERVAETLENPVSYLLQEFQRRHPLFAEIIIADTRGVLVAATSKTSDFWQADEEWWQQGAELQEETVWIEGVSYDRSAGVYGLDVVMSIYSDTGDDRAQIGIIKGLLNTTPLFASVHSSEWQDIHPARQILLYDERTQHLGKGTLIQAQAENIQSLATHFIREDSGWKVARLQGERKDLIGFSALRLAEKYDYTKRSLHIKPMHVVVYDDLAYVMSTVNHQIWLFILLGGIVVIACIMTALHFADRKILAPVLLLRAAAQGISETARLKNINEDRRFASVLSTDQGARTLVDKVRTIQTGNELEQLAEDFSLMARRVLDYHQQLEREMEIKSEEFQRDLKLAREFQEAMLPKDYPDLPEQVAIGALQLHFEHIYKPALLVGGDFFDLTMLSGQCAGILIADVVGHGTRSALITSILRSLLQNLRSIAGEPDTLLTVLNHQFYNIMPHRQECFFATIFYLVLDVGKRRATYASAGHPSPLLLDRENRQVTPLHYAKQENPAIGIFPTVNYKSFSRQIKDGDAFVLYTDGITEAVNEQGEQFGQERLQELLELCLEQGRHDLTAMVLTALHKFMDTVMSADDICLVTADVRAHSAFIAAGTE